MTNEAAQATAQVPAPNKEQTSQPSNAAEETKAASSGAPAGGQAPAVGAGEAKAPQASEKNSGTAQAALQEKTEGAKGKEAKGTSQKAEEAKDAFAELKLPEKSFLTAEDLEDIKDFAKEKGLSPEQAQLLVERESLAVAAYVGAQKEALKHERETKWMPAIKSDKDLGGERFAESEQAVKEFLARFDTEGELRKALEESGFSHFPPLWKVLARAGRAAARDKIVPGTGSDVGKKVLSDAEVFYGKSMKAAR